MQVGLLDLPELGSAVKNADSRRHSALTDNRSQSKLGSTYLKTADCSVQKLATDCPANVAKASGGGGRVGWGRVKDGAT